MVARHLLFARQDDAVERIAAHAQSIGGDDPEIVEAVERVRDVRGMDEQHIRVFRTEAVADLMELLDAKITGRVADSADEPLDDKSAKELRTIARQEGVAGAHSMRKDELVQAIEETREQRKDGEQS